MFVLVLVGGLCWFVVWFVFDCGCVLACVACVLWCVICVCNVELGLWVCVCVCVCVILCVCVCVCVFVFLFIDRRKIKQLN